MKPKVLIVALTDDPFDPPGHGSYGGGQRFTFDLGRHLVRDCIEVVFITRKSRPDKPIFQELGPLCRVYRLAVGPPKETDHHSLWRFTEELCERTLKVVRKDEAGFTAVVSSNWISGLAAKRTEIRPLIHHILSLGRVRLQLGEETSLSDQPRDAGELAAFAAADYLICVCEDELDSLKRLYPEIDPKKALIIPYGVDADVYQRRPLPCDLHLRWKAKGFKEGA